MTDRRRKRPRKLRLGRSPRSHYRAEALENRHLLAASPVVFVPGAGYSAPGFTPTDIVVGKFNSDAYPDLVVGNADTTGGAHFKVLLSNGRGGFTVGSNVATPFTVGKLATGDLNNDG